MKALGLAFGLGLLAWAESALACSCLKPSVAPNAVSNVPANTRIWIPEHIARIMYSQHIAGVGDSSQGEPEPSQLLRAIELRGPTGEVADLKATKLDLQGFVRALYVIKPGALLSPGSYELRVRQPVGSRPLVEARFDVGASSSYSPPKPASARARSWFNQDEGMCGHAVGAELELDAEYWLVAYRIESVSNPAVAREGYVMPWTRAFYVGTAQCTDNWDFTEGAARLYLGSLDYTGKFSGFGPPLELTAPWSAEQLRAEEQARFGALIPHRPLARPRGCACRIDGQADTPARNAALVLLIGWARRRRRTKGG